MNFVLPIVHQHVNVSMDISAIDTAIVVKIMKKQLWITDINLVEKMKYLLNADRTVKILVRRNTHLVINYADLDATVNRATYVIQIEVVFLKKIVSYF